MLANRLNKKRKMRKERLKLSYPISSSVSYRMIPELSRTFNKEGYISQHHYLLPSSILCVPCADGTGYLFSKKP